MTRLPGFRLETYFSRWEFTARYHLTASDAQTMTLGELLALAEEEDRAAFGNLPLGYPQTYGDPALCDVTGIALDPDRDWALERAEHYTAICSSALTASPAGRPGPPPGAATDP